VLQLDEEVEGMQSTIQALKQQLASTRRDSEQSRDLIHHYENAARLKQEIENEETASSRASSSGSEDQSNSDTESEINHNGDRSRSPMSSSGSFEEGEYVSGSENEESASVTSFNEQIDEYEILESVASDSEDHDTDMISISYTPNDNFDSTLDQKRRKRSSSHVIDRRSRSPNSYIANDTHIVTKSSRPSEKETRTYVNSSCSTKSVSKRRKSSDKPRSLSLSQHYGSINSANDKMHRQRRSSEHKLRTDCRIVVTSHSDNTVTVNSS